MPNDFTVQNRTQVIVHLRFARAVSGAPQLDAPDIDHRAWNNPHFSVWTDVGVRGGLLGMLQGQTVRVKLVREHLDYSAPIHVTVRVPSGGTQQVSVTAPAADKPVEAAGIFQVKGTAVTPSSGAGNILEARLGAKDGPILCECEVRVFSPGRVFVTPHVCTVHTTSGAPHTHANGTAPSINVPAVFSLAQAIWRPAGVELVVDAAVNHDIYSAPLVDSIYFWGNAAGEIGWLVAQPGLYVSTAPGRLNAYFIRYSEERMIGTPPRAFSPLGLSLHRGNMGSASLPTPGVFVAVEGVRLANGTIWNRPSHGAHLLQELANDVAHEIGHFFTLSHFGGVNSPGRDDTYARRNLMHPNNLLPDPVASGAGANNIRFKDCGYGTGGGGSGHRGCMVTMKRHNLFPGSVAALTASQITPQDCQAAVARMQIFQTPGRPFPGVTLY